MIGVNQGLKRVSMSHHKLVWFISGLLWPRYDPNTSLCWYAFKACGLVSYGRYEWIAYIFKSKCGIVCNYVAVCFLLLGDWCQPFSDATSYWRFEDGVSTSGHSSRSILQPKKSAGSFVAAMFTACHSTVTFDLVFFFSFSFFFYLLDLFSVIQISFVFDLCCFSIWSERSELKWVETN